MYILDLKITGTKGTSQLTQISWCDSMFVDPYKAGQVSEKNCQIANDWT